MRASHPIRLAMEGPGVGGVQGFKHRFSRLDVNRPAQLSVRPLPSVLKDQISPQTIINLHRLLESLTFKAGPNINLASHGKATPCM
jgi:hypothetical protein